MLFSMLSFTLFHMNISKCISYKWTTLNPPDCLNAFPHWAMAFPLSTLTLQCLYAFLKKSRPKSQWDISQLIPFQLAFQKKETAVLSLHVIAMLHLSGSGGRMDGWLNENKEAAGRCYDAWIPISLSIRSLNFPQSGIRPNWFQHIIGRCFIKKNIFVSLNSSAHCWTSVGQWLANLTTFFSNMMETQLLSK